ncbi:MAG: NADH-quinone oxidoreductase subunit C/D [Thermoanaerobaculales bacterium]|jgi:NADH-quinone oxidoreductase subunit C/D|nr:NADH-quinone oxidoreductase subunit C/D [Thermoanaerobaculales bacterium]
MTFAVENTRELEEQLREKTTTAQRTADGVPTFWLTADQLPEVSRHLRSGVPRPFTTMLDLTAIDERERTHRDGQPDADFTVVYHLFSFERNQDIRLKVPLQGEFPSVPTTTGVWPAANWYEREVWDMFGIGFDGHPEQRRILMPPTWQGHPLRKEHPARATELGPFELTDEGRDAEQEALRFNPDEWGMKRRGEDSDFLFLNLGPQHPGTHGVLRVALQLDGELIVDAVPDIGYHHRGAEKMGERQSWHSFIPYTDRIDYLSGVQNNYPYVLAVEKLAGIQIPDRAMTIRVMMAELFRIASHLVWYGTFAQDVGALSPVFFMFVDRERIFDIVEAVCGGRMHPSWFRIGGVAHDLPEGWDRLVSDFIDYLPARLDEYHEVVMKNRIFKARTKGVGQYSKDEAVEWGLTGPNLRACGLEWDFRRRQPYGGYENFDFDVPTAEAGDCYARGQVRIEEIRQSLRIIRQCLENMPEGPVKAEHPLTTPPPKAATMADIETLIHHFLSVSWGPVIPPGEVFQGIEAPKGFTAYYLISDGSTGSYRTRIRAPSFAHLQTIRWISRGVFVADLLAILGSIDFVLADVDR